MRRIVFKDSTSRIRSADLPENFPEALAMLDEALALRDKNGANMHQVSAVCRIAYALFEPDAPNPTVALVRLMVKLCERENRRSVE